jgi:integrase
MGEDDNPDEKRFRPLEGEEIKQYDAAAKDASDALTELTARTLLHTGLQSGEYSHLRRDWLEDSQENKEEDEETGNYGFLSVPASEECTGGAGAIGQSTRQAEEPHDRSAACYKCRTTRGGHWAPKSSIAVRKIPMMEKEVYELLEDWFRLHEQIPLLHGAVGTHVQKVAERAELSREVKPHDLRLTYGTILARSGMSVRTIAAVMGYNPSYLAANRHLFGDGTQGFERSQDDETDPDSGTD